MTFFDDGAEEEIIEKTSHEAHTRDPKRFNSAVLNAWNEMQNDISNGGPLQALLLHLRENAIAAIYKLVFVAPEDVKEIRRLQDEVLRHIHTVQIVSSYRTEAKNVERVELKKQEQQFLSGIENGDYQ